MRKMSNIKFEGTAIDNLYKDSGKFISYGIYPSMFIQGVYTSDISKSGFYNNKTIVSLKRPYIRGVELYAKYVNIPLIQGLWILLLILILILALLLLLRLSKHTE